jgi:hypothetical protein
LNFGLEGRGKMFAAPGVQGRWECNHEGDGKSRRDHRESHFRDWQDGMK